MRKALPPTACFSPRRASVLLVVLVLLTGITMAASGLIYLSRLESLAAESAVRSVQLRMASVSGLPYALEEMALLPGEPVALNQSWAGGVRKTSSAYAPNSPLNQEEKSLARKTRSAWSGETRLLDQGGLLNLNVYGAQPRLSQRGQEEQDILTRFLDRQVGLTRSGNAPAATRLADEIRRYTGNAPSQSPATGRPENVPSLWATSQSKTRLFRTVDDISRLPSLDAQTAERLKPFFTVASASWEVWRAADNRLYRPVAINALAPENLLPLLKMAFPDCHGEELQQYALNLLDARDADSVPSFYQSGNSPVLGYEQTPLITEVCADVITLPEDDDNGEYVEIYNPLNRTVSLQGWQLRWGQGQVFLEGSLEPGAILIVTDDFADGQDGTPEDDSPGMGSFLKVFGLYPQALQRILEAPGMDLPDGAGQVALYDANFHLVDYLNYSGTHFQGNHIAAHRPHPFIREGEVAAASPFTASLDSSESEDERWTPYLKIMNQPFSQKTDLLLIPCGLEEGTLDRQPRFPAWAETGRLDARLLDMFTLDDEGADLNADGLPLPWRQEEEEAAEKALQTGRINLNTAPAAILEILPGLYSSGLVSALVEYRSEMEKDTQREKAPFASLADVAAAPFWAALADGERLDALSLLLPYAAWNSSVFRVETRSREISRGPDDRGGELAVEALIFLDSQGRRHILNWHWKQ